MIQLNGKHYQLFFSNNLEPLRALNYADELFFNEFERLSGARYRILSVIRKGWQEKYGLQSDIEALKKHFEEKLSHAGWAESLLDEYETKRTVLTKTLEGEASRSYVGLPPSELAEVLMTIRNQAGTLDAMSNMLHLFSSLVGDGFLDRLRSYGKDADTTNQNFIFYTQPIKESKYAKLLLPELPGAIKLSAKDANLSAILRTGAYIKDDVSALLEERGIKLENLFKEMATRLSLEVADLCYYTLPEILGALRSEHADTELLAKRIELTVLFYPERNLEIREGAAAETFLAKGAFGEVVLDTSGVSELKGQAASLGKASGRAVVVRNSDEAIAQMKEGDVLVAPYTAPEYLPAMKRSAAIVTETGGITSHAAIVSRELKIPCVIGVQNVMSVLKTGDEVEVDAEKGIVRKV